MYDHPNLNHRPEVWNLILSLGRNVDKPWIIFGDFNIVLYLSNKWGDRACSEKKMSDFHEVLIVCELRDLGYVCYLFTLCNNREEDNIICERLDCFLANS